jgi:hypothetical protein
LTAPIILRLLRRFGLQDALGVSQELALLEQIFRELRGLFLVGLVEPSLPPPFFAQIGGLSAPVILQLRAVALTSPRGSGVEPPRRCPTPRPALIC